jgi:hypothetical protein
MFPLWGYNITSFIVSNLIHNIVNSTNYLRVCLYMFRATSAHPQEVLVINYTIMQPPAFSFSAGGRLVHLLKTLVLSVARYLHSQWYLPPKYKIHDYHKSYKTGNLTYWSCPIWVCLRVQDLRAPMHQGLKAGPLCPMPDQESHETLLKLQLAPRHML